MVSLVLGNHPAAANLGEASFIPKLLALGELCTCGEKLSVCTYWGRVFANLRERSGCDLRTTPYGLFLGDALKSGDGSGLIDHEYQSRWRYIYGKARGAVDSAALLATPHWTGMGLTTLPSVRRSVANTLALYDATADALGKQLIIDASKLPRKAPHLYLRDPQHVRVLHLVRDGRGVVASRKKYMSVDRAAERWNHYHRLTSRVLERWVPGQHYRRMRYEDFVADPASSVKDLLAWLEMSFSSQCLEFDEALVMHSAGGNPARFGLSEGIRKADEHWRTTLTENDMHVFQRRAGALNRAFGYE
jgi:hypothetical protein